MCLPRHTISEIGKTVKLKTEFLKYFHRQLIRQSWGSQKQLKIVNAVLVFVIGEFNDEKVQTEILKESKRYYHN